MISEELPDPSKALQVIIVTSGTIRQFMIKGTTSLAKPSAACLPFQESTSIQLRIFLLFMQKAPSLYAKGPMKATTIVHSRTPCLAITYHFSVLMDLVLNASTLLTLITA